MNGRTAGAFYLALALLGLGWMAHAQRNGEVPGQALDEAVGARALFGRPVEAGEGNRIGAVEDIVFDPAGRIELLVIRRADAGFTAVPWRYVEVPASAEGAVQIVVAPEKVDGAPTFQAEVAASLGGSQWRGVLNEFWGEPPRPAVATRADAAFEVLDVNRDGYVSRSEAREVTHAYVYVPTRIAERFQFADRNGDGQISETEFSAFEAAAADRPGGPASSGDAARERPSRENNGRERPAR